jgi:hypothetical protein
VERVFSPDLSQVRKQQNNTYKKITLYKSVWLQTWIEGGDAWGKEKRVTSLIK